MGSKNLVPRNSGEGGLGTSSKPWGSGYYDNIYVTGAAGAFIKVQGGGGGGSTSPGGSNTQIQFNNAGSFGGSSNLTWDGSVLNVQGGITGNSISGTTGTFLQRPSVNGVGVLLQGEAASSSAAGSEGQIQFADVMGDFSASPNLTWNGSTLNVTGTITGQSIEGTNIDADTLNSRSASFTERPYVNGTGVLLQTEASKVYGDDTNQGQIQYNDGSDPANLASDPSLTWDDSSSPKLLTVAGHIEATTGSFDERPSVNGSGVLLQGEATSASAGGNDTEVQYNDGGSFSGSSNFTWNNSDSSLSVIGSISGESLSGNSLDISGATPQLNIRGSSSQYIYLHHSSGAAAIGLGEAEPSMYITPPSGLDFLLGYRYGSPGRHLVSINEHSGHLIPGFSGEQDLGSADKPWRDLYIEENSIYLGGKKLSVGDDQLKLNDKTVAADFSIREVSSSIDTDTTLITDYLKQVHVQGNCTVTLPSDDEFKNFKTTYTATEPGIYIGFVADDGGGSITLEGKATGIGEQWDSANVYRSNDNWYIEGNNLKNASNNPSITDFSAGTITNTSIQVSITSDQTVSGYVTAVPNESTAPTSNQLKASSFYNTNINTGPVNINITSLDIGTAYDLYAIVLNSAEEESSISSILNVSTDGAPNVTLVENGEPTENSIGARITSDEGGTAYILATGASDNPNTSEISSNPNVDSFSVSASTPVTRTLGSLTSNTEYKIVGYVEDDEGANSSVESFTSTTAAGTNPTLIDNGLQVRMFGWNDPYSNSSNDLPASTVSIVDGGSSTPSSQYVVKSSTLTSSNNARITGVLNNWSSAGSTLAVGVTDNNGLTKTGILLDNDIGSTSSPKFISFPQIQNNVNGSFESDMAFITGYGTNTPKGYTICFWLNPTQDIAAEADAVDKIVKAFHLGDSEFDTQAGSNFSIGLSHDHLATELPAIIDGSATDYMFAGSSRTNPPDPWDDISQSGTWTFFGLTYDGGPVAYQDGSKYYSDGFSCFVGTGIPSNSNILFYSGDGTAAGFADEMELRGDHYRTDAGVSKSLVDISTSKYAAVIGGIPKNNLAGSNYRFWPGYMSDFRIYNRVLSTGEIGQIFTGNGNY